jgi:hypothetical protein
MANPTGPIYYCDRTTGQWLRWEDGQPAPLRPGDEPPGWIHPAWPYWQASDGTDPDIVWHRAHPDREDGA